MLPYCTYVTYHPIGKFYVGKGVTASVAAGKYRGSGKALQDAFKKYPKDQWTTDIVSLHEDEQAAYDQEAVWVDADLLADPDCLNLVLGGHGWTSAQVIRQNAEMWKDPKYAAKMSAMMSQQWLSPQFVEKVRTAASKSQKARWEDPEYRATMTAVSNKTANKTWRDPLFQGLMAKKAWAKPEYREHQAALSVQRMKDPAYKANLNAGCRRKWQDPVYRAKMSAERSARIKSIRWMTKDGVTKQVHVDLMNEFLAVGWKRGMK